MDSSKHSGGQTKPKQFTKMSKTEGATKFIPTPETIEAIKTLAYTGMTQEEIAEKLGRDKDTIFINSKKDYPELYSAYFEGKRAHKEKLLKDIEEIGDLSKDDSLRFKVKQYQLGVLHHLTETTKTDITSGGKPIIEFITRSKE